MLSHRRRTANQLACDRQQLRRLRVGFDARWYNDSGVGAYVQGLLGAMAQLGDELDLVIYEDARNPVPLPDCSNVRRVLLKAKKYSFVEQVELARRCSKDMLHIFHTPFYVVPLLAHCPVVVTVHDLIPFLFPIYSKVKQTIVRGGYRMGARKAAHIIADSDNTARDIQKILRISPARVSTVHLAASEVYRPKSDPGEFDLLQHKYGISQPYVLLASARNWRTKNLETALRVLKAVHEMGVNFQTVVYGSPEGSKACKADESIPSPEMKCVGYIAADELAMLYRHARVFLFPSLYEGFGLPVLEAMACGCAVVASNGGALAEVAGSGAQAFDPHNVRGMADAVRELLSDPAKQRHWKEAALRRSADFSWMTAARETVRVYHQTHKSSLFSRVAHKS
jgi:glycosyltransferase involved in cell wall biosynthesis